MKTVIAVLITMSVFYTTHVFAKAPILQSYSLTMGYIPSGFDDNDNVQVTVEGFFSDTCYKVGPTETRITDGRIELKQMAYRYLGMCLQMLVPFSQTVNLGILKNGEYQVVDSISGMNFNKLPVAQAKSSNADDYLYASVSDAFITKESVGQVITIAGAFTNTCLHFKEIKARVRANVIEVLPIVERSSAGNCKVGYFPFKTTTSIPQVMVGKYLLHVRSLDGQAINKLVHID